jgi:hypothetical protein
MCLEKKTARSPAPLLGVEKWFGKERAISRPMRETAIGVTVPGRKDFFDFFLAHAADSDAPGRREKSIARLGARQSRFFGPFARTRRHPYPTPAGYRPTE